MNHVEHKTHEEIKEIITALEYSEKVKFQYSNKVNQSIDKFIKTVTEAKITSLSKHSLEITTIMNRLSFGNFCKFLHYIDSHFPGLSFHYVMEARHNTIPKKEVFSNYTRYTIENNKETLVNKQSFETQELRVFYDRLIELEKHNLVSLIFSPLRARLVSGLLDIKNNKNYNFLDNDVIIGNKNLLPILSEEQFLKILKTTTDNLKNVSDNHNEEYDSIIYSQEEDC